MEGGERQSSDCNANTSTYKVLVAVKADKAVSKTALAWALTHVAHPGDCITLHAIFSTEKTGKLQVSIPSFPISSELKLIVVIDLAMNVAGRRFWNFPIFPGDCGSSMREELPDRIYRIYESCSQMALQFHSHMEVTSDLPNCQLPPFSFNIISRSKRSFYLSLSLSLSLSLLKTT
jgi:hypothetical protein